ncbi:hypothetical protein LAZ67_21001769 [Cordylochernes scorpioides]|uniref:Transposase n=1 Tax=Cordylochernes scorpioides TaxID=51811 RepID=A0ABY6LQC2_9ARAC|nr:hypothetical protein LAZ67_21001769 [Cordylochernes scorpioides]
MNQLLKDQKLIMCTIKMEAPPREIRNKLNDMNDNDSLMDKEVMEHNQAYKERMKKYADSKNKALPHDFKKGSDNKENIYIDGKEITMTIDTGSDTTFIGLENLKNIFPKSQMPTLNGTERKFYAYGQTSPLPCFGYFFADVSWGERSIKEQIFVIEGKAEPLLGKKASFELEIIKRGTKIRNIQQEVIQKDIYNLIQENMNLFQGQGNVKGYSQKITLKENVTPVAQRCRHFPYKMVEAINQELDKMIEDGIIEEVHEASEWISNIVAVPKKGFLDMQVFWIVFDFYLFKKMDQRTCIKFCVKNEIKCADAFRMLTVAYGEATLDRSNVYRWYKMFSEGREDVNDEERAGRPSTSTTDEKINEVEKMILANRRITVREVAEDLNISIGSCHSIFINDLGMRRVAAKFVPKLLNCDQKQHRMNIANEMLDSVHDDPNLLQRVITGDEATISRRLVANGLLSCRPLRRLPLTPPNRRQRLEWCRARSTWMAEWHRVVFSDESRFCLSSDSRRVRVWRRRGERYNPAAIVERPTVRQRGIMVRGAIAYDSRSPLLRIQGTMTAQRYVDDVLRPVTLPYLQGVPNALYQQDNARPHTARISQQALQDVQMLPWPPYSPDLSPIEHVWDIIGRRLHALPQSRSEDELWQMVEREWNAIPQDAIRTLIDSLPRRVAACIAVRGGPTCY